MNIPINIEGDWVRADQIAAIDSCNTWSPLGATYCFRVTLLSGEHVFWYFDTHDAADQAKLKAVKEWVKAL